MDIIKVGFQGVRGAYSEIACNNIFNNIIDKVSYNSFIDVIEALINKKINYGVIPIANSIAGRVSEVHNILLAYNNIYIVKEYFQKIDHKLLVINDSVKLEDIQNVYSHPQALMQCSRFINKMNYNPINSANTAIAAKNLFLNKNINDAVIGSSLSAELYNLVILKDNISNNKNNYTNFIVLANKEENLDYDNSNDYITTLIMEIDNKAGSLYKSLGFFADNKINLLQLESYIPTGYSDKASFLLTILGHYKNDYISNVLNILKNEKVFVKILGSYKYDHNRGI